jgi:hypothetical protein
VKARRTTRTDGRADVTRDEPDGARSAGMRSRERANGKPDPRLIEQQVDAGAFKALVKAAVAQNGPPKKKR